MTPSPRIDFFSKKECAGRTRLMRQEYKPKRLAKIPKLFFKDYLIKQAHPEPHTRTLNVLVMLFHDGIARLLPLYGCRRFGRDVIDNAVDPLDLVYDAVADLGQEIIWEMEPVCCHGIGGNHGT